MGDVLLGLAHLPNSLLWRHFFLAYVCRKMQFLKTSCQNTKILQETSHTFGCYGADEGKKKKSNNCLQTKTKNLLYRIFILRTDQCPFGWDSRLSIGGPGLIVKAEVYRGKTKVP